MNSIQINNHSLHYKIVYQKNRKTVKLRLENPDLLEITVPSQYPIKDVEKIIFTKRDWIQKQIGQLTKLAANPVNKSLVNGAQLLYRGQICTLQIQSADISSPAVTTQHQTILLTMPLTYGEAAPSIISAAIKTWYQENAILLLREKTFWWSKQIGVMPQKIQIKDQKTRWGSCSNRGGINYNWRLIMAPDTIVDYLVVHELCHMRIPNHSPEYWQLVEQYIRHYKQSRRWLKENGRLLTSIL